MGELYKKVLHIFFGTHKSEVTFFDLKSGDKKNIIKSAIRRANEDQRELVERSKKKVQLNMQRH